MQLQQEQSENALLSSYQASIDAGEITSDPSQKVIIVELQEVFDRLIKSSTLRSQSSAFEFSFSNIFFNKTESVTPSVINRGLYIWGGVGRGKTHLVDLFYKVIPIERKMRLHFHRFMQLVHEELNQLDGVSDPLNVIAKSFSKKARLLVLDEILVNDITDAMLLGTLFKYLFENGVVLITTSNMPPDELYKNGLQRERFKPAIALLEQYTKVLEISGKVDYRLQLLSQRDLYLIVDGSLPKEEAKQKSYQQLLKRFEEISAIHFHQDRQDIIINGREIPVEMWADGVVWFSFEQICNSPRSTADYSQIATIYHTVLISDIPIMDNEMNDAARRFTNMIDIFYDFHVNLIVSAHAKPENLYTSNKLKDEFKRTASRLKEMQSKEYLQAKHLP